MTTANPSGRKRGRPATSPEEREKQLQAMAYDVAEEQLRSGKASSQLLTLLIKGGGVEGALQMEKLRSENRLLNARIESMEALTRLEASVEDAVRAFQTYNGNRPDDHDD